MKVRWREHEFLLVTMLAFILLGAYGRIIFQLSDSQVISLYAAPFINNHTPFNLYFNVVVPAIGMGLVIYLAYCWFHFFAIPRFLNKKGWPWLILQMLIITMLLSAALIMASYYEAQWQYNYAGFAFFPKPGHNPNAAINIYEVYISVAVACVCYMLYAVVREIIVWLIERPDGNHAYRALICNRITLFLVIYICIPFIAAVFHLVHDGYVIAFYYTFIVPVFLVFMTNTYWLFPAKGSHAFTSRYLLLRLLLFTFLFSLLALLSPFNQTPVFTLFGFWAFQVFIVTPITWLLYQQQKDKILELKGVQKELVKSTAHLQFLRSQINPHFLFNTLNTLYGTALEECADRTGAGIQRLGDMMRFMLYENTLDFIDMNREIDYLKNYIALQKLRIAPSADITIDDQINEQHCRHRIAPMLLIPFVENAFKHGINLDKKSWISIRLDCSATAIHFTVSNSVHPEAEADPEKEHGGIGNKNVMERLNLIYPCKHRLKVTSDEKQFVVHLAIFV